MSRAMIGGVVAVVVSALTATAYFVTTSSLEGRIRRDVQQRVAKAQELLIQNASLEGLTLLTRTSAAARDEAFVNALKAGGDARSDLGNQAFRKFLGRLEEGEARPDFLALADAKGDVVAVYEVSKPVPDAWKNDKGDVIYPAVKLALREQPQATSEIWNYEDKTLMRVGVAPVIDVEVDQAIGVLVLAYPLTSSEAQRQQALLGMDVGYFYADRVHSTSFHRGKEEDVQKQDQLKRPLFDSGVAKTALEKGIADKVVLVELGDGEYLLSAGRLPRVSSGGIPKDYPAPVAGAVVLMSLTDALAPIGTVKVTILLLGAGALVIALLAMFITAKRILAPLDEIEVGINDIINGNLDRTFRPVGSDLDGLANALNVMLARMLGRPEPGEEEYDENGNVVGAAQMSFEEQLSPADAEAVALAREPEPDYYKRIFGEYVAARKQVGEKTEGITYEGFVTKLRLNEGNLKTKHGCRAVRFRVVIKENKVSLKPVPIF